MVSHLTASIFIYIILGSLVGGERNSVKEGWDESQERFPADREDEQDAA